MIQPQDVLSPKNRLSDLRVIHNGGEDGPSIALGNWDGSPVLLCRWNGNSDKPKGNPISNGFPTWMVLPSDLIGIIAEAQSQRNT